jgi:hypothetical protein
VNLWRVILSTLAIFTAGIFTGAIVNNLGRPDQEHPHRFLQRIPGGKKPASVPATKVKFQTNRPPANLKMPYISRPPGRGLGKEFVDRLDRELQLTPEQHQQLVTILTESQERTKNIWEKISPELREEMRLSREKMRAVFTPEQAQRFDALMNPAPKPAKDAPATNAVPAPATQP